MGNANKKKKTDTTSKVGKDFACPLCNKVFNSETTFNTLNIHIIACAQNNRNGTAHVNSEGNQGSSNNFGVNKTVQVNNVNNQVDFNNIVLASENSNSNSNVSLEFEDYDENSFPQIQKGGSNSFNFTTLKGSASNSHVNNFYYDDRPFVIKIQEFKSRIQSLKVDWREAHCKMEINRDILLKDSMKKYEKIDPYKELKINFKGEISHDAGGIIREWFTVLLKELQSPHLFLFERGDTNEFSYCIKKHLTPSPKNLEYFEFLGKLIAKALLDNITLNLCFNKLIYKIILNETVKFEDLIFIDRPLYTSLTELRKNIGNTNIEDLCLYYVNEYRDEKGNLITDELVENGANILVTDLNDYISKRIDHMVNKNKIYISEIKKGLFKYIPESYVNIFNSDEFELLINGQPFIDVEDWKNNTIYQGKYSAKHKVVKWFWDMMYTLTQEDLSKFLQFCTGSSRVPIGGFAELESNRGEIAKFCVVEVKFTTNSAKTSSGANNFCSNFIKAHTCFNRIDLPAYNSEKQLKEAISFIINNEILGFGID